MYVHGSRRSWTISERTPEALIDALLVRDYLGIQIDGPAVPPPLYPDANTPGVQDLPVTAGADDLATLWARWWTRLLDVHSKPTGAESVTDVPSVFLRIMNDHAGEFRSWSAWQHESRRAILRANALTMRIIVDSVAAELARPLNEFELNLVVLPVRGLWAYRTSQNSMLVSDAARSDTEALESMLLPILREVA